MWQKGIYTSNIETHRIIIAMVLNRKLPVPRPGMTSQSCPLYQPEVSQKQQPQKLDQSIKIFLG
jgi:hypothetical protein